MDELTIDFLLDKVKRAPEPVFSTAEQLSFQSFHSVFQTGLVDPALLNAVMLSFAFEIAGGYMDRECLLYQGQAIGYLREKMNSPDEAASEPTIGTILLLAGVEVRRHCSFEYSLEFSRILC